MKFQKGNTFGFQKGNNFAFKKGHKSWNKDKTNVYTKETIEKMKKVDRKGQGKGISKTINHKKNISKARKGKYIGNKSPNWQGGISFEPYSVDWTKTLKRSIRERDHYTCQICKQQQCDRAFDIHHIDYDKLNCNPNNLVTLCRNCHMKTNFDREYWIKYFNKNKYG